MADGNAALDPDPVDRTLWADQGAEFCPRRVYRFRLWRRWGPGKSVLWIMLNPSTADEHVLDPTIRRCVGYSKAWGYEALTVVNLFAVRSTDPRILYRAADPIGQGNLDAILDEAGKADLIVAAWGNHGGGKLKNQGQAVRRMLLKDGRVLHHLGLTKQGQPTHPLYQPKNAALVAWV